MKYCGLHETMVPLPETVLQIFVHSGHFLILEKAQSCTELSQVNKVVNFCNGFLRQELTNSLTHYAQGQCHGGKSTCQASVLVFSSKQISIRICY
jgi:hypothetical protein